jgi:predicted transglutaminase-like cysteine proteinase
MYINNTSQESEKMKKVITILIAVVVVSAVLFAIAMGVKKYKENNALATADSTINISNDIGNITINESVATQMLSQYSNEVLGINKPINEYIMKLSEIELYGDSACSVELFLTEKSEIPEAKFAISGYDCFVYDITKNEYLNFTS